MRTGYDATRARANRTSVVGGYSGEPLQPTDPVTMVLGFRLGLHRLVIGSHRWFWVC